MVKAYVAHDALTHLVSDADWDAHINDFLALYSERTYCLYRPANVLGASGWLFGAPPVYDLLATGFWAADADTLVRRVFLPVSVSTAGRVLRNAKGRPGPIGQEEMLALDPDQATPVGAQNLRYWSMVGRSQIRVFPAPSTAGTGRVEGYYLHPAMTADGQELDLPDHHERLAAVFVAAESMRARAAQTVYERMEQLLAGAGAEMERIESEQASAVARKVGGWEHVRAVAE